VLVTPPGTELRVGGGPYSAAVTIAGVSRVSTATVTLTFNPAVLRIRSVQEGTFMRQGGNAVKFGHQVDPAGGRVDIVVTRTEDQTGASGSGPLAVVQFDAVAPGSATINSSGVATAPGGAQIPLQFTPVTITVR
jgi:hypothetical protein